LGLLSLLTFVFFGIRARFPILHDDWDWMLAILTQPLSLRTVFQPHNEHLIPLPPVLLTAENLGADSQNPK
jgi:hypothetical protein